MKNCLRDNVFEWKRVCGIRFLYKKNHYEGKRCPPIIKIISITHSSFGEVSGVDKKILIQTIICFPHPPEIQTSVGEVSGGEKK